MPVIDSIVEERRTLASDHFVLRVRVTGTDLEVAPARFFMLRRPGAEFPLLSRPMSVCDYDRAAGGDWHLEFLFKVVGTGTRIFGGMEPGETLRLLGPVGRPFSEGRDARRHLLVAGGIGIAPFPALVRALRGRDVPADAIDLYFGARSAGDLVDLPRYEKAGIGIHLATDDGSRGAHGTVLSLLEREVESGRVGAEDRLYGCGPDPMLDALARFARRHGIPCELSLEAFMACGFGVCNSCVVPVQGPGPRGEPFRYEKVCTDGPVFDAMHLWLREAGTVT